MIYSIQTILLAATFFRISEHRTENGLQFLGSSSEFALAELHRDDVIVSDCCGGFNVAYRNPRRAFPDPITSSMPVRAHKISLHATSVTTR